MFVHYSRTAGQTRILSHATLPLQWGDAFPFGKSIGLVDVIGAYTMSTCCPLGVNRVWRTRFLER